MSGSASPTLAQVTAFMAWTLVTNDISWVGPTLVALERLGDGFADRVDEELERLRRELREQGWPAAVLMDLEALYVTCPVGGTRPEHSLRAIAVLLRASRANLAACR